MYVVVLAAAAGAAAAASRRVSCAIWSSSRSSSRSSNSRDSGRSRNSGSRSSSSRSMSSISSKSNSSSSSRLHCKICGQSEDRKKGKLEIKEDSPLKSSSGFGAFRTRQLLRERKKSGFDASRTHSHAKMGTDLPNAGLLRTSSHGNSPKRCSNENSRSKTEEAARR